MVASAIMMPFAILAVPMVPPLTPIATMMVAHCMAPPIIVEEIIAVAGIPIAVIPTAAKAYIVKAAAVVAVIIAVIAAIGITIIIVIIAVAGVA
jgi:hypothetical protein